MESLFHALNVTNLIMVDEIQPLLGHLEQVAASQLEHGSLFALGSQCFQPHPDIVILDVETAICSFVDGHWYALGVV